MKILLEKVHRSNDAWGTSEKEITTDVINTNAKSVEDYICRLYKWEKSRLKSMITKSKKGPTLIIDIKDFNDKSNGHMHNFEGKYYGKVEKNVEGQIRFTFEYSILENGRKRRIKNMYFYSEWKGCYNQVKPNAKLNRYINLEKNNSYSEHRSRSDKDNGRIFESKYDLKTFVAERMFLTRELFNYALGKGNISVGSWGSGYHNVKSIYDFYHWSFGNRSDDVIAVQGKDGHFNDIKDIWKLEKANVKSREDLIKEIGQKTIRLEEDEITHIIEGLSSKIDTKTLEDVLNYIE